MINTVQSWLEQCPEEDRPTALAALGVVVATRHPLEDLIPDHFYPRGFPWRLDENLSWALELYPANCAAEIWKRRLRRWPGPGPGPGRTRGSPQPLIVHHASWCDAGLDPVSLSQVLTAAMWGHSPLIEIPGRGAKVPPRLRPLVLDGMAELQSYRSQRRDHASNHLIIAADPREARFLLDDPPDAALISIVDAPADTIRRIIADLLDRFGSHHLLADLVCLRVGGQPRFILRRLPTPMGPAGTFDTGIMRRLTIFTGNSAVPADTVPKKRTVTPRRFLPHSLLGQRYPDPMAICRST